MEFYITIISHGHFNRSKSWKFQWDFSMVSIWLNIDKWLGENHITSLQLLNIVTSHEKLVVKYVQHLLGRVAIFQETVGPLIELTLVETMLKQPFPYLVVYSLMGIYLNKIVSPRSQAWVEVDLFNSSTAKPDYFVGFDLVGFPTFLRTFRNWRWSKNAGKPGLFVFYKLHFTRKE